MKLRYLLGLMSTICIAGMPSVSLAGQWKQDTGKPWKQGSAITGMLRMAAAAQ